VGACYSTGRVKLEKGSRKEGEGVQRTDSDAVGSGFIDKQSLRRQALSVDNWFLRRKGGGERVS